MPERAVSSSFGARRLAWFALDVLLGVLLGQALLLVAVAALLELLLAEPLPLEVYLAAAGFQVVALGGPAVFFRSRRWAAALAMVLVLMAALHVVPWTTRKRFLRDLDRITPGMTAAEVDAIMGGYTRIVAPEETGGGRWEAPGASSPTVLYRHDAPYADADCGVVAFDDGRVVEVSFSPD